MKWQPILAAPLKFASVSRSLSTRNGREVGLSCIRFSQDNTRFSVQHWLWFVDLAGGPSLSPATAFHPHMFHPRNHLSCYR